MFRTMFWPPDLNNDCLAENASSALSLRPGSPPTGVNLCSKPAPKLQFGGKIVLETVFRLSKLVNRNRVSLQFHFKIEILEGLCGDFLF